MKKIFCLLIFALMFSCGIDYDGETRLVTQTRLIDTDGNPIKGQKISIGITDNDAFDMISSGKTNSNGEATLIFPAPSNLGALIDITIDGGQDFNGKQFANIERANFIDYKLSFDNTVLYKNDELTFLNLGFNQTSTNTLITDVSTPDNPAAPIVYLNPIEDYHEFPTSFPVPKNSIVNLQYIVRDTSSNLPVDTTHTVTLTIGNDVTNYTINY